MEDIKFSAENIPIMDVAKLMKISPQTIREGIINGTIPIGRAFKRDGSSHYSFYINQKMLYEFTGCLFNPNGDKDEQR